MSESKSKRLLADVGALPLIKRLLKEQARPQWKRYLVAGIFLLLSAAATAVGAYLVKDVINKAYVDRDLEGLIILAFITSSIFMIKSGASYLGAVQLARIGNRIV